MANSPLTPTGHPGLLFKSEDAMEEFVVKLVAQATNPRYASGFLLPIYTQVTDQTFKAILISSTVDAKIFEHRIFAEICTIHGNFEIFENLQGGFEKCVMSKKVFMGDALY